MVPMESPNKWRYSLVIKHGNGHPLFEGSCCHVWVQESKNFKKKTRDIWYICRSIDLSIHLSIDRSIYLSIYLSIYRSIYLSIYVRMCLWEVLLEFRYPHLAGWEMFNLNSSIKSLHYLRWVSALRFEVQKGILDLDWNISTMEISWGSCGDLTIKKCGSMGYHKDTMGYNIYIYIKLTHRLCLIWACLLMGHAPRIAMTLGHMMIKQWIFDALFSDQHIADIKVGR